MTSDARPRFHRRGAVCAGLACVSLIVAGCGAGQDREDTDTAGAAKPVPVGSSDLAAAPWRGFLRDARHSSTSPALGPQTGRIRWTRVLEGAVVPGPAVGPGGVVYAASNGGVLHAIDLRTGRDRWTFDGGGTYGSDLSTVPAILRGGTVLWPGPDDTLYGIDRSGRLRWTHRMSGGVLSPLAGPRGTIYVADTSGRLDALSLQAGGPPRQRWSRRLANGASYSSPALGPDGTVYAGVDRTLYAVRDEGGDSRVLWTSDASEISEVSPAVTPEGTVISAANDSVVRGLGPNGSTRWTYHLDNITYSSAAASGGHVVIGDSDGHVVTVDGLTGRGVATTPHGGAVWTAPARGRLLGYPVGAYLRSPPRRHASLARRHCGHPRLRPCTRRRRHAADRLRERCALRHRRGSGRIAATPPTSRKIGAAGARP